MPNEQLLQAFQVHRLADNVLHDLADQRMIGNLAVALNILLAGRDLRKHTRQQIVGTGALNLRRNLLSLLEP